jgi:hypothetical protein
MIHSKWVSFQTPAAVGLDATRFDQHTSYEMIRYFEHLVYKQWFNDAEFNRIISWQLENKGSGYTPDGQIKAEVKGCRMSGDMNTSSGNCLIMCCLVWAYAKRKGICCKLINNGDDCVVFMEARDVADFVDGLDAWFLELGYSMKVEQPVYEIEKIEFCQAHPVCVGPEEYLMVRNVIAALSKDSMALINADHKHSVASWCASVGEGGSAAYGDIPILGDFYRYYMRQGEANPKWAKAYQTRGFDYLSAGMNRRHMATTEAIRYSFYVAFGILPAQQEAIEQYFENLDPLAKVIPTHPHELSPQLSETYTRLLQAQFA